MKLPQRHTIIGGIGLAFVIITSAFVMWMAYTITQTLSGPGWCRTALGADKATSNDGTIRGLEACVNLLTIQLKSLATNSHILFGIVALCLGVLVVIVLAGARLSGKIPGGGEIDVSRQDAAAAAQTTAAAAQTTADEISAGAQ